MISSMSELNTSLLLWTIVAAVFTLGGFVKGVVGLGLPTITMGLLSVVMLPAQAAALLVVPSLVTNLWQIAGPGFGALCRRLFGMLAGVCIGVALGAGWLSGGGWASMALGVALIVYAVLGLLHWRLHVRPAFEAWLGPVIGVSTGLVTAATGVFVIPAVPYLGALGLGKDDLIQALGLSFTVSTVALALTLAGHGAFGSATAGASLLALAPALLGMVVGGWMRGRVSETVFRRCFCAGLFVLGAHLASRALV